MKKQYTGKHTHPTRKEQQRRREQFSRHAVRLVGSVAAVLLALLVVVPLVKTQQDRAAMRRIDAAFITLPPQEVDTLYISTPEPTAAPKATRAPESVAPTVAARPATADEPVVVDEPVVADEPYDDFDDGTDDYDTVPGAAGATEQPKTAEALLAAGASFEYLPVINTVDTMERKVAITVDDCFQVGNLQKIIKKAYDNGGRLTIFPIGQNLSQPGISETLRKAVQLGFEIENHTWSHARVFRLPEEEMASEIWRQSQALNQCLGMNYEEHFFRCMGGDGEMDQRTHNYLKQLGFLGVAHWSISGSDATPQQLVEHLTPGAVFLFHTTDKDTKTLMKFIPWVVQQGYQLVTLNELLGYPENATSPLSVAEMPEPQDYVPDYRTIHVDEYSWMVVQLQNKLRALGMLQMEGASTGYYGKQTAAAVAAFQSAAGLPATGEADAATQLAILQTS